MTAFQQTVPGKPHSKTLLSRKLFFRKLFTRKRIALVLTYLLLSAGAIALMLPFPWMVSTALKSPDRIAIYPPEWIPHPMRWSNFSEGWTSLPFTLYLKNTCLITASAILGTLLTASLAAYSFARLRWPGRDLVFLVTLATLMLPSQVTLIPVFLMFRDAGWLNTFLPLTVGAWLGGGAVNIFLIRQFMLTVPVELEEAARLDGCGTFGIFWRIVLPQLKTCLGMIAVFTFLATWNDFMGPLIYLTTPDKATLALGLQFFQGHYGITLHYLMAVSLIVMSPCLLLFLLAQRLFVTGFVMTGIKG